MFCVTPSDWFTQRSPQSIQIFSLLFVLQARTLVGVTKLGLARGRVKNGISLK